jgi:hypothetical protein
MNNFLEGLKDQISTFRRCDDGLIFFASNSGDFTGSSIRISI